MPKPHHQIFWSIGSGWYPGVCIFIILHKRFWSWVRFGSHCLRAYNNNIVLWSGAIENLEASITFRRQRSYKEWRQLNRWEKSLGHKLWAFTRTSTLPKAIRKKFFHTSPPLKNQRKAGKKGRRKKRGWQREGEREKPSLPFLCTMERNVQYSGIREEDWKKVKHCHHLYMIYLPRTFNSIS